MGSRSTQRRGYRLAAGTLSLLVGAAWLAVALTASATNPAGISTSLHEVAVDDPAFQEIRDFLKSIGMTDAQIAEVATATDRDKLADQFDADGAAAKIQPKSTDIVGATFFELHGITADALRQGAGTAPGGAFTAVDPIAPLIDPLPADEWYGYFTTTNGPFVGVTGERVEAGLAAFTETPPGGGTAVRYDAQQAGNFFGGFNVAWSTRSDEGGPFQLYKFEYLTAGGSFGEGNTDALSFLRGSALITLVPEAEASGFVDARAFAFTGNAAGDRASDTYPDMADPPRDVTAIPVLTVGAAPEATPTPTPVPGAPTSAPASAVTEPSAEAPSVPGAGTDASGGAGMWLPFVLAGLAIAAIGGWLLWGPRRGPVPARDVVPAPVGGPPDEGPGGPVAFEGMLPDQTAIFTTVGTSDSAPPLPGGGAQGAAGGPMPTVPTMPDGTPPDFRKFIECKVMTVDIKSGDLSWLSLPEDLKKLGKPTLTLNPGKAPGTVDITLKVGEMPLTMPASISPSGELKVDTSEVPEFLGRDQLDAWVRSLNDWFKGNGNRFGPPTIGDNLVTLAKEPIPEKQAVGTDWAHLTPTVEQWDAAVKEAVAEEKAMQPKEPPGSKPPGGASPPKPPGAEPPGGK